METLTRRHWDRAFSDGMDGRGGAVPLVSSCVRLADPDAVVPSALAGLRLSDRRRAEWHRAAHRDLPWADGPGPDPLSGAHVDAATLSSDPLVLRLPGLVTPSEARHLVAIGIERLGVQPRPKGGGQVSATGSERRDVAILFPTDERFDGDAVLDRVTARCAAALGAPTQFV